MGADAKWYAPKGTTNEQVRMALEDAYNDNVFDNLVHEWGVPSLWWNDNQYDPHPEPLILSGRSTGENIVALVAICDRLGGYVDYSDQDEVERDYTPTIGNPLEITEETTELFRRFAHYS